MRSNSSSVNKRSPLTFFEAACCVMPRMWPSCSWVTPFQAITVRMYRARAA